jgi:hypothetical protein
VRTPPCSASSTRRCSGPGAGPSQLLTRTLASFLQGVSPTDGLVFASSAVFLLAVALAAMLGPVAQATRVNPADVLRNE